MDVATKRISDLCARLTNYERDRPRRIRFDLRSMAALLARPGAARLPRRLVQVGGSKGKGTTARYLAALHGSSATGTRTGVYQSPHVETVLERVRIDGHNVDLESLEESLVPILRSAERSGLAISFYEAMTAAALECFAAHGVEFGVLEVGLGGRLDATTAVPVDATILTMIELEHTEILGDTIEQIAGEKAAILRGGKPAIVGVLEASAFAVIAARAHEVGAELIAIGRDFDFETTRDSRRVQRLRLRADGFEDAQTELRSPLRHEAEAVAIAWRTLLAFDPDFRMPTYMERPASPGCMEMFESGTSRIVLDGAHTEASMRALAGELRELGRGKVCAVLFAAASGKRWRSMLAELVPTADQFFVTDLAGTSSVDPAEVVSWLHEQRVAAEVVSDAAVGLQALRSFQPGVHAVTGSFYLVGAVRPLLRGDPAQVRGTSVPKKGRRPPNPSTS